MWISKAKWLALEQRVKDLEEKRHYKQNKTMGVGEPVYGFSDILYPDYIEVEEAIRLLADKLGAEFAVERGETKTLLKPKAKK